MPMVVPVSEMQRNGAELVNRAMETKEPIYLTRRGYKSVVLVDADEYDRLASAENARIRRALEIKDGVNQGYQEIQEGHAVSLDQLSNELDAKWGKD